MPDVISVVSGKGGVGKSTTALALAAALQERGMRVDLVDLDPQGGATYGAGLDTSALPPGTGVANILEGRPLDACRARAAEGFGIFPASIGLLRFERRMLASLGRLRDLASDVVVVDTPPGVGEATQAAASVADRIIVPLTAEPAATQTLPHVLALIGAVKQREKVAGIVLCSTSPRTLLGAAQRDELAKTTTILAEIPRGIAVAESINTGQSIIGYAPRSPQAEAYRALARVLRP